MKSLRKMQTNQRCPNCGSVWFNRLTGKCRSCSARAAIGYGKSTASVDMTPLINRDTEASAMDGVWYS